MNTLIILTGLLIVIGIIAEAEIRRAKSWK